MYAMTSVPNCCVRQGGRVVKGDGLLIHCALHAWVRIPSLSTHCFSFSSHAERGVVWEETIILLPDNVHYVFLSATIPNARQFAEWICHLHQQVSVISIIGLSLLGMAVWYMYARYVPEL